MGRPRYAARLSIVAIISMCLSSGSWADQSLEERLEEALLAQDTPELSRIVESTDRPQDIILGRTPLLHRVVLQGDADMVGALLDAGLPVNARDPRGDTALTLAAELGNRESLGVLLEKGADKSLENGFGLTASQIAQRQGDDLLALKLYPYSKGREDAQEWLISAAARGDVDTMKLAIGVGGKLNVPNEVGQTVLQIALAEQQWDTIRYLADLPQWLHDQALHESDVKFLFEFALMHPKGSKQRLFASRSIAAFLNAEMLAPRTLRAALPSPKGEAETDTVREALRQIGLSQSWIDSLFPEPSQSLPRLEYKLRMDAPPGGIKPLHWKRVQVILKEEGLYDGPIDGIAGQGTYDAVYAYVIGIAPLVVERARYADGLARRGTMNRFGVSEVLQAAGNKEYLLSGERIRVGYGSEAVGYTVFSEKPDTSIIKGYMYDAVPVPSVIHSGWNGQTVSVTDCSDGLARRVSADLLGNNFWISLGEQPYYRHLLPGSDAFEKPVVGKLPQIECE